MTTILPSLLWFAPQHFVAAVTIGESQSIAITSVPLDRQSVNFCARQSLQAAQTFPA
jgi:hypothetical protein